MLNIIEFRKSAPGSPGAGRQLPPADVEAGIAELASCVTGLQSKARGDIGNAILMLDLAAQHAREIAMRVSDPSAKKDFDEHISIIERLLELAREMAFKL
jgi:hypothetical protein